MNFLSYDKNRDLEGYRTDMKDYIKLVIKEELNRWKDIKL